MFLHLIHGHCQAYTAQNILTVQTKAKLLQVGIFFLIQLFAGAILLIKKLEIEKLSQLLLYQF